MSQFVYKSFIRLYSQGLILSMPQILTGYAGMYYFKYEDIGQYFFIGCASCILLQICMLNSTRGKLLTINLLQICIGVLLITLDKKHDILKGILVGLGLFSALDWQLTIAFIRETVGWEEGRAIYINTLPYMHLVIGIVICNSVPNSDEFSRPFYYCLIGVNTFRMLSILFCYHTQPIVYHYRRFEELKGSIIINEIYKGRTDEIEYFHIINNEQSSKLNLSAMALLSPIYRLRFLPGILMNILLWIQLGFMEVDFVDDQKYIVSVMILLVTIVAQFILKLTNFKLPLIISQSLILSINVYYLINLFYPLNWIRIHQILSYIELGLFMILFLGVNMYTTQILPQKGMVIAMCFQWISLVGLFYLNILPFNSNYVQIVFPILSLIGLVVIMGSKQVYMKNEQQIQEYYK